MGLSRWFNLLLAVLSFYSGRLCWAYPSTIGHGYTACATCHYNPHGYGPLTDYGRALAATTMAGRPPFWKSASDEELGERSGFLGKPERLPDWLRLAADFRGMLLLPSLTAGTVRPRFIPMQLEGSVVLRAKKETHVSVVTLGYAPRPAASSSSTTTPQLISREHYYKFRASKQLQILGGMTDIVFGTRVPDHLAFHRRNTGLAQNDQTHGLMLHWSPRPWDLALHGFLGNLFQSPDLRQKGLSLQLERTQTPHWVYGLSFLHSSNSYRQRQLFALHSRSGHEHGSSLLFELGLIRTTPTSSSSTLGQYVFLQPSIQISRGLYALTTIEHSMPVAFSGEHNLRIIPGVIWAPFQRLEFRVELQTNRGFGAGSVNADVWNLWSQVHVWL